jgi:UDP-glucose 4-epimerase
MPNKVVVTGGAGFIGSNLAIRLVELGYDVTVLDNLSTGKLDNLAAVSGRVRVVQGDIRDEKAVRAVMDRVDVVFHQAALPSVPRSIVAPVESNAVNVDGTLNILAAARDAGVRRVVYASSSSVYGDAPELPKREETAGVPRSPYAVSKLAAELYCRVFTHVYRLETVSLRYFNVYGPRQNPDSEYAAVVPRFIRALLHGDPTEIYGDGEQTRSFTFVTDVVDANLKAAAARHVAGEAFNIAGTERTSLNELHRQIRELVGADPSSAPRHAEDRAGDVKHSYADLAKAKRLLGYAPRVSLAEGLQATVQWVREQA